MNTDRFEQKTDIGHESSDSIQAETRERMLNSLKDSALNSTDTSFEGKKEKPEPLPPETCGGTIAFQGEMKQANKELIYNPNEHHQDVSFTGLKDQSVESLQKDLKQAKRDMEYHTEKYISMSKENSEGVWYNAKNLIADHAWGAKSAQKKIADIQAELRKRK